MSTKDVVVLFRIKKLFIGFIIIFCWCEPAFADREYGGYVVIDDRADSDLMSRQHIGRDILTAGLHVARTYDTGYPFSTYIQKGVGVTLAHDLEPVYATYSNGISEESSIDGARIWAGFGLGKEFLDHSYFYLVAGAAYFMLMRTIDNCSGCSSERINVNLEPFLQLGLHLCEEGVCLNLEQRKYYTTGLVNGTSLSFVFIKKI